MAEVAPFRGLRYNRKKVPNLAEVVIPPYDVISPEEQERFHQTSPYNMINLELGKATPADTEKDNPHTRAGRYMDEWQERKILIRDEQPAIYYYEMDYSLSPKDLQTRYGFLCALRLEDFSSGGVRPHEKTFSRVKQERLGLMHECHANLSPVFALYSDPEQEVDHALRSGREAEPIIRIEDNQGLKHRLWRVRDLDVLQRVRELMRDKVIYIADGHHRYETALTYRNEQRSRFESAGPRASFEYIMMYLSNLNQGGLTILPTHRLLRHLKAWNPESFIAGAKEFFDISRYEAGEEGEWKWRTDLEAGKEQKDIVIGFASRGADELCLLKARRDAVGRFLADMKLPRPLQRLDVEVLDQVILKRLMGLEKDFLANEKNIHFRHDLLHGLSELRTGGFDAGFFINPTRIEQVQEVASTGLIMPHKSTYFYPKVGSGMVIHSLAHDEEALW